VSTYGAAESLSERICRGRARHPLTPARKIRAIRLPHGNSAGSMQPRNRRSAFRPLPTRYVGFSRSNVKACTGQRATASMTRSSSSGSGCILLTITTPSALRSNTLGAVPEQSPEPMHRLVSATMRSISDARWWGLPVENQRAPCQLSLRTGRHEFEDLVPQIRTSGALRLPASLPSLG
jgi:hypothetical protein